MVQLKKKTDAKVTIPIAPMIDCVFLLLIYFMVAATLQKQEADISFQLPGVVEQTEPVEMPDEQIIEINDEGQVVVNEYAYDTPDAPRLIELSAMLSRFKQASDANQVDALVTIAPADGVNHQTIVKVMDAVSYAGIKGVNFSLGDDF
ncbi:ExbD/TolR family protein [Cerasicoccus arenae]|uniref:Biopolymer transporter ExbD n=1 Tax=Cerasicoccus arenae TaxID=424488 RepID=A0A8J3GDZ1_9BACT|nr:biopolymer transporter ExbD [Cerasicoccus arenae]MBK1856769.1 biopolymer transporter ExbD [Cerasicoccus arenae]GHB99384.1 biopolymer transporter ExbD [Cerasicoccus arenae]